MQDYKELPPYRVDTDPDHNRSHPLGNQLKEIDLLDLPGRARNMLVKASRRLGSEYVSLGGLDRMPDHEVLYARHFGATYLSLLRERLELFRGTVEFMYYDQGLRNITFKIPPRR